MEGVRGRYGAINVVTVSSSTPLNDSFDKDILIKEEPKK
jgi:hypothetical protein